MVAPLPPTGTRKVAAISMFTALAVVTDYAMFPLANVKLMDSIVFVSALAFGLEVGVSVGALTWLVYGEVNPLGPDGGLMLLILVASETVYALLGYAVRRTLDPRAGIPTRSILWGSLGLIGAFVYDLITNTAPALVAGDPPRVALGFLIPAAPFMVAHELSDLFFFATVAPLVYAAVEKVARRQAVMVPPPLSSALALEPLDVQDGADALALGPEPRDDLATRPSLPEQPVDHPAPHAFEGDVDEAHPLLLPLSLFSVAGRGDRLDAGDGPDLDEPRDRAVAPDAVGPRGQGGLVAVGAVPGEDLPVDEAA
ncbi:MAG: hypothetical protein ABSF83_09275 [Nitrososphaerales archaeon]